MKKITLTQGQFALVDDSDYEWLNQWKWYCSIERGNKYALRREYEKGGKGKSKTVKMHRLILGLTNSKELCDHRDMNGLNNQRHNLRKATPQQNLRNRNSEKGSSKYKGVYKVVLKSKYRDKKYEYPYWKAAITIDSKEKGLGLFKYTNDGEILAAKAYDEAAKKYYGEFANLNFKI